MTYEKTVSEEEDYLIRYIHFRVQSPLDIVSIEPEITEALPVPLNNFNTFVLTLQNKGTDTVTYSTDIEVGSDVVMLLKTVERQYSIPEIEDETFKLLPESSKVYQIKVAVMNKGKKTASISFTSTGACSNVSDSLNFQVTGFETTTGFFNVEEVGSWDWLSTLILLGLVSIILYRNFIK
jgi:hypothetical protein